MATIFNPGYFDNGDTIGPQGPQGPRGIQGPQGEQGIQGEQGVRGYTGPQGIQGIQGPQGIDGSQGPTGPAGATGSQGPQGEKGDPGGIGITDTSIIGSGIESDPLRVAFWKAAVANVAALPTESNATGDVRKVLDTFKNYYWNGSSWIEELGGNLMATFNTTLDFGTGSTFKTINVSYPDMTTTKIIQVFYTSKLEEVAILGMTCGESAREAGVGFTIFGFAPQKAIGEYTLRVIVSGT